MNFLMIKMFHGVFIVVEVLLVILKILYYICESICGLFIPKKKKDVTGEIVLITGAGHGIGRELAIGYATLGATVVCWDVNQQTNEQTMNEIKIKGINSIYAYQCDVTNREAVFKTAEIVKKEVGNVTILVNNAGVIHIRAFQDLSFDEIKRMMDVNIMAHYWTLQAFLPNMIKQNHGHIVAISSVAGLIGIPYGSIYCTTKSAVKALMEFVSEELRMHSKGKSFIKFTTVYPIIVHTGLVKNVKIRFPSIMGQLSTHQTASFIIDAQRRNIRETSIHPYYLPLLIIGRMLPFKAMNCVMDFLDYGFEPDELILPVEYMSETTSGNP